MLVAVGLNQEGARLSDRVPLAVAGSALDAALADCVALDGVDEVAVLSTSYRFEIFATSRCPAAAGLVLRRAIEARAGRALPLFELRGQAAFERLARVASSLESAILGEPEIFGQVKAAFDRAVAAGTAGDELAGIVREALEIATRVRHETALGVGAPTWGHAVTVLAEKILGPLRGRAVAVVGAGEMARLSARHLAAHGASVVVLDPTLANGEALAREVAGTARRVEALEDELRRADVVVSADPTPHDGFGPDAIASLMKLRRRRIVLVDLAVPCAIPAATGRLDDVYLCGVDDLDRVMSSALSERARAAAQAERIVAEEAARWSRREAERRVSPLVGEMRARAGAIARAEVERTLRRLGDDPELARRLDAMAGSIVERMLQAPSTRLVRAALDGSDGQAIVAAAARIFDLPGEGAPPRSSGA